jgi:outer membrane murein-binding lipoprotein Lpp
MHASVKMRRFMVVTFTLSVVVFGTTFIVGSSRAQAGQKQVTHTCSAPDHQFLNTVSSNMQQLTYWSDSLVQDDVEPAVVIKQAKAEAAQVDATRPTDPTFEQTRGLLRSMFTAYARAIYAKTHGGNAGVPMRSAYMLANGVHDLLAGAQADLAARGCDPTVLLRS